MTHTWNDIENKLANLRYVEGGFTIAKRGLLSLGDGAEIFVKIGSDDLTKKWARKEIAVYRFLEKHNYPHSPRLLAVNSDESGFAIEAFTTEQGWDWEDNWDDKRLEVTLKAIQDLADIELDKSELQLFGESNIGQDDNGWKPLLDSKEKQEHLMHKLHGIAAEDVAKKIDFPKDYERSAAFKFAHDTLVHYDIRADNCAWNKATGQVRIVDWNWSQLGDNSIEYAATLTAVQKSGFDLPKDLLDKLNSDALHRLSGYWFNSAVTPIWEGGPEHLRDFQLLFGVTSFRLASKTKKLK